MSKLVEYVLLHSVRGECRCGRCIDVGNKPDPEGEHLADVQFFKIGQLNDPKVEELKQLIAEHEPCFGDKIDLFDGNEHGFIEIGGWIGSQQTALLLMGLGASMGMFDLMTPNSMMPDLPDDLKNQMAQSGLITIKAKKAA